MDTRSKIVTAESVRGERPVVVTGYFDVLTADLTAELEAIRARHPEGPLAAVVLACDDELLGLRARAELVAALAVIDYVLVAETQDSERLLESVGARARVSLEAFDGARNQRLREHVRRRHAR